MAPLDEPDFSAFESDLSILLEVFKKSFETDRIRHFFDDNENSLYIEIDGLEELSSSEIEEVAGPILEELDLDFDEVILLPYTT